MKVLSCGAGMQSTVLALMSCKKAMGNPNLYPKVRRMCMSDEKLTLPRAEFEPMVSQPLELDALGTELSICFQDLDAPREIKTCYGDICKIVNALRDYARMLRMVCEEWGLQGYHRAVYELHADKLEEISKKYQAGIGYDYDKAVEKCRKRQKKQQREDDVGGEAMAMAYLKAQRTVARESGEAD